MARGGTTAQAGPARKKKGGFSLGSIMEVLGEGRAAEEGRTQELSVAIRVAADAPRQLALTVKECFVPEQATAHVDVRALDDDAVPHEADLAVIVGGAEPALTRRRALGWAGSGVPVAVVVESALDMDDLDAPEELEDLVTTVAATSGEALREGLARWAVSATDKSIACAAGFSFCRKAKVAELTSRCALGCAGVGAVELFHGADIYVMGVSQAKLALDIAACYGRPLDVSRGLEVGGVLGAGLAWRALSRSIVEVLPGLSHLVKAGVAYGGTIVAGRALSARFELEDGDFKAPDLSKLAGALSGLTSRGRGASPDDTLVRPVALPSRPKDDVLPDDYVTIEG